MFRAFLIAGAAFDLVIALFLLVVAGWVIDSWHDPVPWTGPIVTAFWSIGFVLSAGAPLLAYRLSRRNSGPGRVAMAVWLPALVLVAVCVIGFLIFPL